MTKPEKRSGRDRRKTFAAFQVIKPECSHQWSEVKLDNLISKGMDDSFKMAEVRCVVCGMRVNNIVNDRFL